jgi:O-antigen/teichoic acid export membrane protein
MKKNPFLQGAMIATIGLFITKVLGIVYVIPFYAVIGQKGGALYGYAYSVYSIFLNLSSIGIPLAMSKITSEYNALGYYSLKERAFLIAKKLTILLSILSFLVLMIFAPVLARIFIGDIQGGNTIGDVTFVLRIVASAILVVPILSVNRGYLQGHRFITPSSVSQVLEQFIRVIIIIVGSYLCIKVFNLPLRVAIGIAVFGATIGAISAYLYITNKINKNSHLLDTDGNVLREDIRITNKDILAKLLKYATPFVFSSLILSFYHFVDLSTIVRTMTMGLNYETMEAETVISILITWGLKLNMIVMAISTGLTTSLIPNITSSYVKKNVEDLRNKINRAIELLFFVTFPMTIGLSLLAKPVWTIFYGYSELGSLVFRYSIVIALFASLLVILNVTMQSLNEYRRMFIFVFIGFIVKTLFNIPLMYSFHALGLHASYGVITATILGYFISILLVLNFLNKELRVNFDDTFMKTLNIIFTVIIMGIIILLLQFVIPVDTANRLMALALVIFYSIIGASIYLYITIKNNLLFEIFGKNSIRSLLHKLKIDRFIVDFR